MRTIGFIGLGLIGASVAKALKKQNPKEYIIAYDANSETLAKAKEEGVIDEAVSDGDDAFCACDYLFLASPVEVNLSYLEWFAAKRESHTILTDVGSVKGIIHRRAEELGMASRFIGGHPMAGSEKSGYAASSDRLLENAYYMITPGDNVPLDRLMEFSGLISSTGAIPMVITPEEHDFIVAGVSHLPHIVAASLVNVVQKLDGKEHYMKAVAAGGFRDITRIASSSPEMWQQICLENKENISAVLDEYIRLLINVRCDVDNRDVGKLYKLFDDSREYRDSIDVADSGLIRKAYVLYTDIADEAGQIATIATILALEKINIKNIGIIHNREFDEGVLKIEFYESEAMEKARKLLIKRNYVIHKR